MSDVHQEQYVLFAELPALSEDQLDDACFRGRDLAWSSLAGAYDAWCEKEEVSYQALGDRIGKSKQQVQRWIDSPHNMTISSLGLLAEGLNSDLIIRIQRRVAPFPSNTCHPAEEAHAYAGVRIYKQSTPVKDLPSKETTSSVRVEWSA